jgi:hypothetical protein
VGRQTGHRIFGKPFVGCSLLPVPQTTLVPAVLQTDWDLLQDHSQGVERHWEVPAVVSLQKQLMFGADLQTVFCSLFNNAMSNYGHIVSNNWMNNNELKRMWKKVVMA